MFTRVTGAALRAVLMALLVLMPSLLLPNVSADTSQITVLVALLAFLMTFIEYYSQYPSIVEFRYASPFNRLRFLALFVSVTLLSVILASTSGSGGMAGVLHKIGTAWGGALDFPFSPVRLMVLMMPEQASEQLITSVRISAGIAYMISLVTLLVFVTMVRLLGWPTRNRAFNVWINLPLFDPTAGGDVVHRLKRDAGLNIVLGILLPFLIPAIVKAASSFIDPISMQSPQTLIWMMTAWAFLPASMIMRGIAMGRIAELIEEKRNRAYSEVEKNGMQTASA
ncbi:hypothetical protein [Lentibacter sp. XHP0401]|uniref:hypothetical protein n=1 Tax=Lentibacter sp. XHP0401 TaxID=2984334 RepID=UPI0021E70CC2|nr:hypothetical protein [Lentibacter sp. XHP0401]MCV2894938.1 hypothetical protein [Lentibacter sp. XHP0401]